MNPDTQRWVPPARRNDWSATVAVLLVTLVASAAIAELVSAPRGTGGARDPSGAAVALVRPSGALGNDGVTPPPAEFAAATFDAADGYGLLFGGQDSGSNPVGTTYSFVHANWTDLTTAVGRGPSARWGAAMTYDAARGYVVLFGGCANAACSVVLNDTWAYAYGRWTNLTSSLGPAPAPRALAMIAYDPSLRELVLFGGRTGANTPLGDTWLLGNGSWQALAVAPSTPAPLARIGGAMAFDPLLNATVLFGGWSASGVLGDTWTFGATGWNGSAIASLVAPSSRWAAGATFDAAAGELLLTGGYNSGTYDSDLWALRGGAWSSLSDANGPPAGYGGAFFYDATDGDAVYFSGAEPSGLQPATYVYANGGWTVVVGATSVPGWLPLLGTFGPAVVPLLLFLIVVPIANRMRRRREMRLSARVVVPPGEVIRWIPTPPGTGPLRRSAAIVIGTVAVVIVPLVAIMIGEPGGVQAVEVLGGIMLLIMGPILGLFLWSIWRQGTRGIAVTSGGVLVRRPAGELRIPWDALQPSLNRPVRGDYHFRFTDPSEGLLQGGFLATVEQSRAILTHPNAPAWVIPGPVAATLGVPTQKAAPPTASWAPAPLGPPPPGAVYYAPAMTPSPGAAPQGSALPSSASTVYHGTLPGGPYTPAPRPAPVTPPPPPPAPVVVASGPPPGYVACRACGHLNPAGQVGFCQRCGRRLTG